MNPGFLFKWNSNLVWTHSHDHTLSVSLLSGNIRMLSHRPAPFLHSGTHRDPDGLFLFVCYHSLDLLMHFCQVATLNYSWKTKKICFVPQVSYNIYILYIVSNIVLHHTHVKNPKLTKYCKDIVNLEKHMKSLFFQIFFILKIF